MQKRAGPECLRAPLRPCARPAAAARPAAGGPLAVAHQAEPQRHHQGRVPAHQHWGGAVRAAPALPSLLAWMLGSLRFGQFATVGLCPCLSLYLLCSGLDGS